MAAYPAAEEARPAAVGKLLLEQMCTRHEVLSSDPVPSTARFFPRLRTGNTRAKNKHIGKHLQLTKENTISTQHIGKHN